MRIMQKADRQSLRARRAGALMVVLAVFAWFAFQPLVLKAEQVDFTVERGATMRAAAPG